MLSLAILAVSSPRIKIRVNSGLYGKRSGETCGKSVELSSTAMDRAHGQSLQLMSSEELQRGEMSYFSAYTKDQLSLCGPEISSLSIARCDPSPQSQITLRAAQIKIRDSPPTQLSGLVVCLGDAVLN